MMPPPVTSSKIRGSKNQRQISTNVCCDAGKPCLQDFVLSGHRDIILSERFKCNAQRKWKGGVVNHNHYVPNTNPSVTGNTASFHVCTISSTSNAQQVMAREALAAVTCFTSASTSIVFAAIVIYHYVQQVIIEFYQRKGQ